MVIKTQEQKLHDLILNTTASATLCEKILQIAGWNEEEATRLLRGKVFRFKNSEIIVTLIKKDLSFQVWKQGEGDYRIKTNLPEAWELCLQNGGIEV